MDKETIVIPLAVLQDLINQIGMLKKVVENTQLSVEMQIQKVLEMNKQNQNIKDN